MQIAIDGPAGAGKSTIAKRVAQALHITYLDTGAMYRAVTVYVMEKYGDFSNKNQIIDAAKDAKIGFDGEQVFLNGQDVTKAIRKPEISQHTSDVAGISEVREILVKEQQQIAADTDVIMDGRDIGSVVLPDADVKIYLDATAAERAKRRYDELKERGTLGDKTLEMIQQDIEQRDYNDTHRDASPLVCCDDAVRVDTTGLDIDGVCDKILKIIGAHTK